MVNKKVTTAEKVGRMPQAAADAIERMRKNLKKLNVPDNVHLKNIKNWNLGDFFRWTAESSGSALKLSGVAALWLTEHLTRVTNRVFIDNSLVRELEEIVEDSARKAEEHIDEETGKKIGETGMSRFAKNHPWVMGYLIYWSMLVASFGGAAAVGKAVIADDKDLVKKEQVKQTRPGLIITDAEGRSLDVSKQIELDPGATNFINQCIALENITCIPIIYAETYRAEPVVQYAENVWTHGFGMTWSRDKNGHMKIRDYADTKANRSKGFTPHKPQKSSGMDQDIADSQQFLIDHIYPKIQRFMKRPITENEFYGLCVAGYQLPGHIDEICENLNSAKTPQQIADAFITPNYENYGGTPKRRWVCGMLAAGYITMQDILKADVDNFYRANLNTLVRNGHFVTNQQTIDYVLGLAGPGNKKTYTVVNAIADGRLALGQLGDFSMPKTIATVESAEDKQISESMYLLNQAMAEYRAGRLEKAAQMYEQAIEKDADNMEAYSSLALVYKKLGDKNKSIDYYEKCVATVREGNARMNANKSLLLDRGVKAASYYNAGAAREEIAKIYQAKGNNAQAIVNYDLAIKNYKTALENAEMAELSAGRQQSYRQAIEGARQKLKALGGAGDKRQSLNKGIRDIRKKNARSDLLLYGTQYDGNMA